MNQLFKLLLLSLTILVSTSCQMHQPQSGQFAVDEELFADHYFDEASFIPETEDEIFYLPEETQAAINDIMLRNKTTQERTKAILALIFTGFDGKRIIYRNTATYTAAETLNNARANCLSLSILAYSLAKRAAMQVNFQDVKIPEYWVSDDNQSWLNGHVNVRILHSRLNNAVSGYELLGEDIVVDFEPSVKQRFDTENIDKKRIIAMFYNNKAAEAISSGNESRAYVYYKAAIKSDPSFAVSWSNLGILYRKNELLGLAELAYKKSLQLNPKSLNAMANLVVLYRYTGREREAIILQEKVDAARRTNPYYFVMLGNEAFNQSKLHEALKYFEKSLRLDRKNHEAYFGLAKSHAALRQIDKAEYYLRQAKRVSPFSEDQERYSRKLELLSTFARAH